VIVVNSDGVKAQATENETLNIFCMRNSAVGYNFRTWCTRFWPDITEYCRHTVKFGQTPITDYLFFNPNNLFYGGVAVGVISGKF